MDAPTLVLVPPTPLVFDIPSTTTPQQRPARSNPPRDSSDAIFSIYSMYGDEQNPRASVSWANVPSAAGSSKHDRAHPTEVGPSRITLNLPNDKRMSSLNTDGYEDSDLAYYLPEPVTKIPPAPEKSGFGNNGMVGIDTSPRATNPSPRPTSSHATPSSRRAPSELFEDARLASGSNVRISDLSASSYTTGPSISKEFSRSGSPHSKRSSRSSQVQKDRSLCDLPPLPPSTRPTPSPTPPRQPSPVGKHLTPNPSMKCQWKHPLPSSSPSSKVSLVPSEGEDMDGFHVRNTYAQLEVSGVKGDGYEEGVERTRARIGTSRSSQLEAESALGDGHEKKRDLDSKEIQVLQSVDRYVHWFSPSFQFWLRDCSADRYGFFSITSHDRLVLLNSIPLLKKLSRAPAGPPTSPANALAINALPPVSVSIKEPYRISKWTRMLLPQKQDFGSNVETWRLNPSAASKLRERTYKGIPDRWRRAAWDFLLSRFSGITPRNHQTLVEEYRDGLEKPSTYDIQIDLDVPRTISGHIMFRTRYGAG